MFSIGVDVGGSHIAVCGFDHLNKCLIRETHSYEKINPNGSKDEIAGFFKAVGSIILPFISALHSYVPIKCFIELNNVFKYIIILPL